MNGARGAGPRHEGSRRSWLPSSMGEAFAFQVEGRVVRLHGELDVAEVDELGAALGELATAGDDAVVLDLTDLTFCDSAGLGVLITLARRLPGGRVVLRSPSVRFADLLDVTGTRSLFTVEPTPASG
jgi:anti-sigma B factor antagonist